MEKPTQREIDYLNVVDALHHAAGSLSTALDYLKKDVVRLHKIETAARWVVENAFKEEDIDIRPLEKALGDNL